MVKQFSVRILSIFFLYLAGTAGIFAQDRGISFSGQRPGEPQPVLGKQYALFIAIDGYQHWPALRNPVSDARDIRDILVGDYYIDEVIELYDRDATKENIIRTFTSLQERLSVHDSLFVYFAGHGHLDSASGAGFWIPSDAGTDRFAQSNWLPNSQIRGYISRLKSIHVFLVSDACFAGDILDTSRSLPERIGSDYYRRSYSLVSRQVLTSGSIETVPDESEFAGALKMCLRKNTKPLIDPIEIYNEVRLSVAASTPLYGTLKQANHQDGATFLFFRRDGTSPAVVLSGAPAPERGAPAPVPETVKPEAMVRIPGGRFVMGSPGEESGRYDDERLVDMELDPFYMAPKPVTVGEFRKFTEATGYKTAAEIAGGGVILDGTRWRMAEDVSWDRPFFDQSEENPVVLVNWFDAAAYCNWKSERDGLTPAYYINGGTVVWNRGADGYRLPTEAEWEYACRAGTDTPFYTGKSISTDQANYDGNFPPEGDSKGLFRKKTTPAESFLPNQWGLYGMHGNIWEWCWDWYGPYPSISLVKRGYSGPPSGDRRVSRGGGWLSTGANLRSASRNYMEPSYRAADTGFRLVRSGQ
ncbi:SUMF1/EgtB/PvdO family nonheme iron enzyme [Breznakiella homolactica]|uniref:SUMF1/EgtB/PvdO family nonheme iron enzyme n=1 Tax=Breznakiella homolactica TaxID=2798577 RepID=A0A7T7XRM1_9SPIR|nr:SUMF1/EgtB/PvdO family nonheme iron enzyme [Breznakiella homolactica]QQO11169.1 SUMF1/EgtB/PvdO family nonheme iron enzyme [Breznakiella homolactica]